MANALHVHPMGCLIELENRGGRIKETMRKEEGGGGGFLWSSRQLKEPLGAIKEEEAIQDAGSGI